MSDMFLHSLRQDWNFDSEIELGVLVFSLEVQEQRFTDTVRNRIRTYCICEKPSLFSHKYVGSTHSRFAEVIDVESGSRVIDLDIVIQDSGSSIISSYECQHCHQITTLDPRVTSIKHRQLI